ncbi:MAG: hypothetical protein DRH10_05710 [Deltaproteobacteria bacterium]|nr:MAG: hypothetical protein DRH10_05710 [Deltaproteobacteria bacterium]
MKKAVEISLLVIALSMILTGCLMDLLLPKLSATATITKVEETGIDALKISYKITNTGDLNIDYYQIYFTGKLADGSTISDWTNGLDVLSGTTRADITYFDTGGLDVQEVAITKIILKNYAHDREVTINPTPQWVPVPYNAEE